MLHSETDVEHHGRLHGPQLLVCRGQTTNVILARLLTIQRSVWVTIDDRQLPFPYRLLLSLLVEALVVLDDAAQYLALVTFHRQQQELVHKRRCLL